MDLGVVQLYRIATVTCYQIAFVFEESLSMMEPTLQS